MTTALKIPPTTLGGRIRETREWRGLEQGELANQLRVSRQTISNWERGVNTPRWTDLRMLAELLDTDLDWLEQGWELTGDDGIVTHRYPNPLTMSVRGRVAA